MLRALTRSLTCSTKRYCNFTVARRSTTPFVCRRRNVPTVAVARTLYSRTGDDAKKRLHEQLSDEQWTELTTVFNVGTANMSSKQFLKICKRRAPSIDDELAAAIYDSINDDGNHELTFEELIAWWPSDRGHFVRRDSVRDYHLADWEIRNVILPPPSRCFLLGAGYIGGQPLPGVDKGPKALRKAGIASLIEDYGWALNDGGDLDVPEPTGVSLDAASRLRWPSAVGQATKMIYDKILPEALRGELCLTLGGDHSLAIGTVAAAARVYGDALRILWVDAHADVNTPGTSPTGNIHGMPLAFLLGLIDAKKVPGFEWLDTPVIQPHQICYIGLRDVDRTEKSIVRQTGLRVYSMSDIDHHGIGNVMERAMKYLCGGKRLPIHLSFDIDALDVDVAPSTGTRVRGGLTFREGCFINEFVAETGQMVSMDLVEVNPSIGDEMQLARTCSSALAMTRSALGQSIT